MRIRLRGPLGQTVLTLSEAATVLDLEKEIQKATSIDTFDVKYGFPPKRLPFEEYPKGTKVSEIDVQLNGEQLIISRKDLGSSSSAPNNAAVASTVSKSSNEPSQEAVPLKAAQPSSTSTGFSFGTLGEAPPPSKKTVDKEARTTNAPLALSRKDHSQIMNNPPEVLLPEHGGTLVLRVMPDDNSCLFRAVAFCLLPAMDTMNELRSVVAQAVQANPHKYTKVVLDNKDPDEYCRWIQTEAAWGGQIELDIFSRHFDVEICSIDVQTLRVDRYNEGAKNMCILVYSGIHYDAIALSPFDSPPEFDIKVFDADSSLLVQANSLCQMLQDKHYFTDTAGFQILCNDCGTIVKGEKGATEHASITGHYNFGEAS